MDPLSAKKQTFLGPMEDRYFYDRPPAVRWV